MPKANCVFNNGMFDGNLIVNGLFNGVIENNLNALGLGADVLSQMTSPVLLNSVCESPLSDMITNGDFSTDTDWFKESGWAISAGKATYTSPNFTPRSIYQSVGGLVPGIKYLITYTIDSIGAGTGVYIELGGTDGIVRTAAGTYTETIICGATGTFSVYASLFIGQIVVIDDVSMTPDYFDISGNAHDGIFNGSWLSTDRKKQGRVWDYEMAGNTDKFIDMGDSSDFSFGDGSNDSPFSIFMLVEVVDGTSQMIASRYNNTTGSEEREYLFQIDAVRNIFVRISDESLGVHCDIETDDAVSEGLHLIEFTYSGVGGAAAMDGGTIYVDGVVVASTATNNASYIAMEDLGVSLLIGANKASSGSISNFLVGDFGLFGIDGVESSAYDAWVLWCTVLSYYSENGVDLG